MRVLLICAMLSLSGCGAVLSEVGGGIGKSVHDSLWPDWHPFDTATAGADTSPVE